MCTHRRNSERTDEIKLIKIYTFSTETTVTLNSVETIETKVF